MKDADDAEASVESFYDDWKEIEKKYRALGVPCLHLREELNEDDELIRRLEHMSEVITMVRKLNGDKHPKSELVRKTVGMGADAHQVVEEMIVVPREGETALRAEGWRFSMLPDLLSTTEMGTGIPAHLPMFLLLLPPPIGNWWRTI